MSAIENVNMLGVESITRHALSMKEAWLQRELAKLGVAPEDAVAQGYQITTTHHPQCNGFGIRVTVKTQDMGEGASKILSATLALCECLHLEKRP